jgi:hypothetical protein
MNAAESVFRVKRLIPPRVPKPSRTADFGRLDCELSPDEYSRLMGEIDSLQVNALLLGSCDSSFALMAGHSS